VTQSVCVCVCVCVCDVRRARSSATQRYACRPKQPLTSGRRGRGYKLRPTFVNLIARLLRSVCMLHVAGYTCVCAAVNVDWQVIEARRSSGCQEEIRNPRTRDADRAVTTAWCMTARLYSLIWNDCSYLYQCDCAVS